MSKKLLFIGLAVFLVLFGGAVYLLNQDGGLGGDTFVVEARYLNTSATSTPRTTLTVGGATSTLSGLCEGADHIDLALHSLASSTAAKVQWQVAFSNDNIDWFWEDGSSVDSVTQVTHGANPLVHYWTPGSIATSTKNVTIDPVASKYCKVDFNTSGATVSLWAAMYLKQAF